MAKRNYDERESKSRKNQNESYDLVPDLYSIFYGEVASIQPYGVFVKIPGFKKQGLVHKSQMSKARVEDPSEMLAVGEKVYCKVVSLEDNKIGLSMKVVNQTTGRDEDSTNVQISMDQQKNRKFHGGERPVIELGAVLDTTCKKCGGHGHLAQDCFHTTGGKAYDLIPDSDDESRSKSTDVQKSSKKKKKKEKKKKSKKRHHDDSSSESERHPHKKQKKHKHHKHKRYSSSSTSDG